MFTKPSSKYNHKGRTYYLVDKRNKQFAALFKKLRNPIYIIQAYREIDLVYKKYFKHLKKVDLWVSVLLYAYSVNFFTAAEIINKFNLTKDEAAFMLKSMRIKKWITLKPFKNNHIYHLSTDGKIMLQTFNRECTSALLKIAKIKPKKKVSIFK